MAQVSPNPANMITVIEVATGPMGPPGPAGAEGPAGEAGPAGSSQPFQLTDDNIYQTVNDLQITGSLTISGSTSFTNIGPAIFSGSITVSGQEYIHASGLDGSEYGYSELRYADTFVEGLVGIFSEYTYNTFTDGTNYNEMQLYGNKTIFLQPVETPSVTSSFLGSLEGTSSWAEYSLTSSYVNLVAGPNITINYQEDNSIEISGSVGGGLPGGYSGQIQFNLNDVFGSSPYFTYDNIYESLNQGKDTLSTNLYSHAEGESTQAQGYASHAEGYVTLTEGTGSHAEGYFVSASEDYSHAEGFYTTTLGLYSHAEGNATIASGSTSHAEGDNTQALGESSHAEGYYTISSGSWSHTEGNNTLASGEISHAEGYYTTASGYASHAEGDNTYAIGQGSHAEGLSTIALGDYSHTGGNSTIASSSYQTVVGQYNTHNNTSSVFTVGGGADDSNRKDVLTVFTSSVTINNILVIVPQHPLPSSGVLTGSFAVSASVPPKPYFYNGTTWTALY